SALMLLGATIAVVAVRFRHKAFDLKQIDDRMAVYDIVFT
ncbi:hypothetical protein Tco_0574443, partial [Tanacetum coccineum]